MTINKLTMIDFWPLLNDDDKDFIIHCLLNSNPNRYSTLHYGTLALVDIKTVRSVVKYSNQLQWHGPKQLKSSRRRVRKRLSVELLLRYREHVSRRERHLKRMEERAARKASK